ncbi:MAG: hypothetical protein KKB51_19555 [Candidatus Riflebacteria bacterium]|nr:hypothetical protein [Candidatus Riflebacteria bacterium]
MKSVLKFGCGFFLFAIALFVGLMMYGQSSGEAIVKEFISLAAKDSPDDFIAKVHPGLAEEVDPELLYLFFKGVTKECGDFEGLNMNGMNFSDKSANGNRTQDFSGNFRFAKKEIPMEMNFLNGLLFGFNVKDPVVAQAALKETNVIPADAAKRYAKRAEAFWQAGLSGKEADAFAMMTESVQKQFGSEKVSAILSEVTQNNGKAESIKFISARPKEPGSSKSLFFFSIDFLKVKDVIAHVTIEFAALKAHLVGFAIPSDEKP